jgi:hypothetical protein
MVACRVATLRPTAIRTALRWPSAATLALLAILAIAAYVRLADIDLGWFMLDQARDVRTARAIVEGRAFPLVGPAIEGGPSHTWGPLYFYLVAVPLAFSRDPTVAAAFLSLLNLLAVYLTYRFGAAFFGRGVGLIAAALFATCPLAVVNARALWNVAAVPLLTVAFFTCLFALVVRGRSAMVIPTLLTLALAPQLHLSAVSFAVVLAAAFLIYRPRIALPHLLVGAGAAALALLPYGVAVAGGGPRGLRTTLADSLARIALRPAGDALELVGRVFFTSAEVATWMTRRFGDGSVADWTLVHRAESWLMLLGAIYPAWRLARARRAGVPGSARDGLLLLWIWVPLVMLSLKRGAVNHYYFDVLYPAPFIAAGVLLTDPIGLARAGGHGRVAAVLRAAVVVLVALVLGSQVAVLHRLSGLTASRGHIPVPNQLLTWGIPASLPDGDTMPLRYRKAIVDSVITHIGADRAALRRRVHGMAFEEVLEDKESFFDWRSRTRAAANRALPPDRHLAVVSTRPGGEAAPPQVGPFRVVAYAPSVDYSSWEYAMGGAEGTVPPPAAWRPLRVPTRGVPDDAEPGYPPMFVWPGMPVLVRGRLVAPSVPGPRAIAIALVDRLGGDHRVEGCRIDETPLPPGAVARRYTPVAILSEAVFDLPDPLREGGHTITCLISGLGTAFDLDVYELGRGGTPISG